MKREDCRLIVFAKAPVPGRVKSRLSASMDAFAAAAFYEELVLHCLSTALAAKVGPVALWCAPTTGHPFFERCAAELPLELDTQTEGDLGRRMGHAFEETLKISTCVLLMGSDCPSLSRADLREGATVLRQGADAVISPAEDGGYVLLGLRQYRAELFTGIPWGTDSVLRETRARLRKLGWRWHELPERWDVDRPGDLKRLALEADRDLIPLLSACRKRGLVKGE